MLETNFGLHFNMLSVHAALDLKSYKYLIIGSCYV